MKLRISPLVALAGLTLFTTGALAFPEIPWFTLDGGGSMNTSGGTFALSGSIGQPEATAFSGALSGGSFSIAGGFWTVAAPTCAADFNRDGFLDFTDFDDFVTAFESGFATADFNQDGFIDFTDFDAFVAAFELGC
jgi:hypothetical protein